MMADRNEGDSLRRKRFGMSDELLRVAEVCPEDGVIKVRGKAGFAWTIGSEELKDWQHIPCGRARGGG